MDLKTKITLVVHAKELKRTTNTGRLALHALVNSEMCIRGKDREPLDLNPILVGPYESYLLYPSETAKDLREINFAELTKPIQIIVPDGNWRQASKVYLRHPELKDIPHVKIATKNSGLQHLRKEHFEEGTSTIEAIAAALGIIEGPNVFEQLMSLYQAKLNATLVGRGHQTP